MSDSPASAPRLVRRNCCPFCDNDQLDTTKIYTPTEYSSCATYEWTGKWAVFCEECYASGPEKDSRAEAVEAWNQAGHYSPNEEDEDEDS